MNYLISLNFKYSSMKMNCEKLVSHWEKYNFEPIEDSVHTKEILVLGKTLLPRLHLKKCMNMSQIWGTVVDIRKNEKKKFCQEMINCSLRKLKFLGNMYFSYTERLTSTKVKKGVLVREKW